MKKVFWVAFSIMMCSVASAAPIHGVLLPGNNSDAKPILYAEIDNLGDGLFGYHVFLDDLVPNNPSPYFLDALTFSGAIQQTKFLGTIDVHDQVSAGNFDGNSGYDKTRDSYFFTPFTNNLVSPPGIVETLTTYAITAGSGGGSQLQNTQVAYIVAAGPIEVSGIVARAVGLGSAGNFSFNGVFAIPEPSTWALLIMGGAALIPIVRPRRKK